MRRNQKIRRCKSIDVFSNVYLLRYEALTPLHVGSGYGIEADLAVQRDAMGIPMFIKNSIKGSFKSDCIRTREDFVRCELLYGSEVRYEFLEREVDLPSFEGILDFTDAFLIITQRIIHGRRLFITSTPQLKRFYTFLRLTGFKNDAADLRKFIDSLSGDAILIGGAEINVIKTKDKIIAVNKVSIDLPNVLKRLIDEIPLLILKGDLIADFVTYNATRVQLNYENKTVVKHGGPWIEEYVPSGSIFIGALLVRDRNDFEKFVRDKAKSRLERMKHMKLINGGNFEGVMNDIWQEVDKIISMLKSGIVIQIGGRETIGKGYIRAFIIH